jgi:FtsP/CotA-like multicopper oxidase with cupredoxin domain
MHTDIAPTTLRGYVQLDTSVIPGAGIPLTYPNGSPIMLNGVQVRAVDNPHQLGPTIVATRDTPTRVKFVNLLPTGAGGDLFLPTDTTIMGAGDGPNQIGVDQQGNPIYEQYKQNRATLHLHGGNTPWISDGTAHQWTTPAGETTSPERC